MTRIFPVRGTESITECPFCGSEDLKMFSSPGAHDFSITYQTGKQCMNCKEILYYMNGLWVEDPEAYDPEDKAVG